MKIVQLMKKDKSIKVMTFLFAFIIIYVILLTSVDTRKYSLKEGDIAKNDIKATRDVNDEAATEERRKQAVNSVGIQYDKNTEIINNIIDNINNDFTIMNKVKDENSDDKTKLSQLKSSLKTDLDDSNLSVILSMNKEDLKDLQQFIIKTLKDAYNGEIREDESSDIKKAQSSIAAEFSKEKFSKDATELGIAISNSYVKPNMFIDSKKTEEIKKDISKKVENVVIKKDQIIVKEGEPVTANEISVLEDLGLLSNSNGQSWYIYVALAVAVLIVLFLQIYYIYR